MNVRRVILLAAGAVLAARAGAEGKTGSQSSSPPDSQQTWHERSAEKARELGAKGQAGVEKGASATKRGVNSAGQTIASKVVGTKTVTGRISDVSKDQVTLQRSSDGQPMNLRVTDGTKVTIGGKEKPVGSLQQGAEVRASYAHSGGEDTAMKIDVTKTPGGDGKTGSSAKKK